MSVDNLLSVLNKNCHCGAVVFVVVGSGVFFFFLFFTFFPGFSSVKIELS